MRQQGSGRGLGYDLAHTRRKVNMKTANIRAWMTAGHWVAEQAPEEMLAALTEFLAPYREGGGGLR